MGKNSQRGDGKRIPYYFLTQSAGLRRDVGNCLSQLLLILNRAKAIKIHASLLPSSTESFAGVIRTHPDDCEGGGAEPSGAKCETFLKPSVRTSEVNGPICFGGKFTTQQTSMSCSSSFVCAPTACTLECFTPISGPKSIFSLNAGFFASGKSETSITFPTRISTFVKSSYV